MKLGFLILSVTPPEQSFLELLEFLSNFHNATIWMHHDFHQAAFPKDIIHRHQIKLTKKCHKTSWSHVNNVLATIEGLDEMLNKEPDIEWFITLTPNCYPAKSTHSLLNFFKNANADAYMDMHKVADRTLGEVDDYLLRDMHYQPWFTIPFISRKGSFYWREVRKKVTIRINPFINGQFEYYQGSNYFYLNSKAVEQIVHPNSRIKELLKFYLSSIKASPQMHPCPQETIIQTFLANHHELAIQFENYRFIDWKTDKWSPNWLTIAHFEAIQNSECHWIRKVKYPVSKELLIKLQGYIK